MTTNLTLKNVPEDLYEELKRRAAENRRSINSEAIVWLERAVRERPLDSNAYLANLHRVREGMKLPYVTDEELDRAIEEGRP